MKVAFSRSGTTRYRIAVEREHGPALLPRFAPGYDDHLPHDLAHYLVEELFEIQLGVFGQLAAGGGGIFSPAPREHTTSVARSVERIGAIGRADMQRSERLVFLCVSQWQLACGRLAAMPARVDTHAAGPEEVEGAVRRIDAVSRRWRALPAGSALTFEWPRRLTFDPASSRRGRRPERRSAHRRQV